MVFSAVASFTNQFLTGMHKAITMFEVSLKAHKQLENNFPKRTEWRWFPLHWKSFWLKLKAIDYLADYLHSKENKCILEKNNHSSMRDFQETGVMHTSEELRKNREQDLSLICTISLIKLNWVVLLLHWKSFWLKLKAIDWLFVRLFKQNILEKIYINLISWGDPKNNN